MEFLYFALIGLCAGWLAGQIWKGSSFGVIGNLIVGVIGSILGGFIFRLLGMGEGNLLGQLIVATIGAIVLLTLLSFISRKPS
jgi:uncharacterized membrane protein YeaQ/YmgE (transglycosylase-associated protein family)